MEKDDVYEELKNIIGLAAANSLVDYYSGSVLYIPQNITIKKKHGQIREEFKKGASYRELARRYEFTERHIRNITKERQEKIYEGRQLDLIPNQNLKIELKY